MQICVSCQSLAPRTCQVPRTPKGDQGGGESRKTWKAMRENLVRTKGSTIAGCDPLENKSDVLEINAFVCLILITEITPKMEYGQSGQMYPFELVKHEVVVTYDTLLIYILVII